MTFLVWHEGQVSERSKTPEPTATAGESEQELMAAVRAADASEAVGKVATFEIIVDYLGDNGAEEAVAFGESFVIDLRELVKITIQQIPQC